MSSEPAPVVDFTFPLDVNEDGLTINELKYLYTLINVLSSSERPRPAFLMGEYKIISDINDKLQTTITNFDKKNEDEKPKEFDETKGLRVNDLFTLKTILEVASKRNCFDLRQYNTVYDVYARIMGSIQAFKRISETEEKKE